MNAETRRALHNSIKHWDDFAAGKPGLLGLDGCALCDLFWSGGCVGCPVSAATGEPYCKRTPYYKAARLVATEGLRYAAKTPKAKAAAKEMADFLRALLPKPKRRTRKAAK